MAYSKKAAQENKQIATLAKRFLADGYVQADVLNLIQNEFPDIDSNRLRRRIDKVARQRSKRGGLRNPPGGRPPLPPDQKRPKISLTLAPGTRELARKIAKAQGLDGWGYLIDQLVTKEAKRLQIKSPGD